LGVGWQGGLGFTQASTSCGMIKPLAKMCQSQALEAIQSCFASLPLRDMTTAEDAAANTNWFIVR
jgi:hypothetical protein